MNPERTAICLALAAAVSAAGAAQRLALPGAGATTSDDLESSETFALPPASEGNWRLTLTLEGTPSNRVEIAFGRDANTDTALGADETAAMIGWDRGMWFASGGPGLEELFTAAPSGDTLTLDISISASGAVRLATFSEGGRPLPFPGMAAVPAWLDPRKWDTARLTARGGGARAESAEISVFPDGTLIRLK